MIMQRFRYGRAIAGLAMLLVVTLAAVSHHALANGEDNNPGVIPPQARFRGFTYEELEARWWQTIFSIPVVNDDHPLFSGGAFAEEDGIVFLAAPFGEAEIEVTIPTGTALFFPIVNSECSELEPDPFHGDGEAEQRACANGWMDNSYGLEATIDGKPVENLASAYRFESSQFTFGPLPEGNLFAYFGLDAPEGTTSTGVDAGYYLLLAPLSVGEHEIHIGGVIDPFTPDDPGDDFAIDTTFRITVAPKSK